MLYHCLPGSNWRNLFEYTMQSVQSAHSSLVARIADHSIYDYEPSAQIKSDEIRYSKNSEFTDDVLINFNTRREAIEHMLRENNFASQPELLNTFRLNK